MKPDVKFEQVHQGQYANTWLARARIGDDLYTTFFYYPDRGWVPRYEDAWLRQLHQAVVDAWNQRIVEEILREPDASVQPVP